MPPAIPPSATTPPHEPRIILYHQTHYKHTTEFVSLLPLITEATSSEIPLTHLIIAAIHLNDPPGTITLNDDPPSHPKHTPLWEEVALMQDIGVKVLGMLGGAARGTFARLDGSEELFEAYYVPLRDMIRKYRFDGLDLDVEEEMSLGGVVRLIDRLKGDFGGGFLVTLAPVAEALRGGGHLSGFDYEVLEGVRGGSVAWYHVQFYNGWGSLGGFGDYDDILRRGWEVEKVVVGVLTNPGLGHGYVEFEDLRRTVSAMAQFYPGFGGVMGWEYFNSRPGDEGAPWQWAGELMRCVRNC